MAAVAPDADSAGLAPGGGEGVAVVAPSPVLTITVEAGDEIHLHAGGQGFWVARMIARLGVPVTLCCALGGETGPVLRALVDRERVSLCTVTAGSGNGAYVHDHRGEAERRVVATTAAQPLQRHEADDLFGAALAQGLSAAVTVLTGTDPPGLVPAGFYRRLAGDLRRNGRAVIADLAGEALDAVLGTELTLLKASDDELAADGRAGAGPAELAGWMRQANSRGAASVVVSRGADPTLALLGGELVTARFPVTEAGDSRGAGDSLTAGIAAALARGGDLRDALRLGTAAGMLNATRRGLGTGRRDDIAAVARQVEVAPLDPGAGERQPVEPAEVVRAAAAGKSRADREAAAGKSREERADRGEREER
jgi:1-phosphofructokinase